MKTIACCISILILSSLLIPSFQNANAQLNSQSNVIATIQVGNGPYGVAIDSTNGEIYVTNTASATVSVISGATNTVTTTIAVGTNPEGIAVNPTTNTIYVANENDNTVSVISGATNTITNTIPVGSGAFHVAVNPSTNTIYVTNINNNTVSVINGITNTIITTIPVGTSPWGIVVNPSTNTIYESDSGSGTVSVINGYTNTVTTTIPVPPNPTGIAVNPTTNTIYVNNHPPGVVYVIDGTSNNITTTVGVGNNPSHVAVNPNTNTIYATNANDNTVSVINGATNTVTSTVSVGNHPEGIEINSQTNEIYVADRYDNTVSVISGSSSASTQPPPISQQPFKFTLSSCVGGLTVTPNGNWYDPTIGATSEVITWNWGDGQTQSINAGQAWPNHTYSSAGTYTITSTITDNLGISQTNSTVITVSGAGNSGSCGSIELNLFIPSNTTGLTITPQGAWVDSNKGSNSLTMTWNWGDGNIQTTTGWPNGLSHTYSTAGSYTITATVTDNLGFSRTTFLPNIITTSPMGSIPITSTTTTGTTTIPQSTGIGPFWCKALNGTWNNITQTCANSFPQTLEARMMVCGQLYSVSNPSKSEDCIFKAQTLSTSEWENYINSLSQNPPPNTSQSTSTNTSNCVVWTQNNSNPSPLNLNYGVAQPNLWNLVSASGNVQQCLNSGSLQTSISLSNIQYHGPGPVGYPEIGYGYDLHDHPFGSTGSLSFPLQVVSYANQNYWTSVSYSLEVPTPNNVPQDFTYDLWLKQNPCADPANNCALQKGDYEVMIEPFDTSNNIPASWTAVGAPFQEQIIINNIPQTSSWQEYTGPSGTPNASLIAFVLSSPSQYSDATISLKLQDFINAAGGIASVDFSNYYLMGIEVGAEFGSSGSNGGNPVSYVDWGWSVSNFSMSNPNTTIQIIGSSTQTTSTTNTQSQSSSSTTLASPTGTIGVQNIITVNSFNVISSGGCENTLTVQLTSCFTIQQNFIINNPLGSVSSYAPQNVIEVGTDKNGKMYAGAMFMVFNGANNAPIACNGVIINDGCDFLFSLQPTSLPVKFYLTSTISNGQLLMNSNWDNNQASFTFPCLTTSLCSSSLPTGSTILLSKGVEQPQLDIVGSATGNGQPGNVATFSSADIDVESFVQLLNSPSWTPSITQTPMPCHGTSTAEQSLNLEIEMNGTNTAHFYYDPGANCQESSQDQQGVGYMPNITSQTATTTTTTTTPSTETTTIPSTTTSSNPSPTYQITFTESGLQQNCLFWIFGCSLPSWSVTLDGNTQTSTSTSIIFNNVNPESSYSITAPSGYSSTPSSSIIQDNTNQAIVFSQNQ